MSGGRRQDAVELSSTLVAFGGVGWGKTGTGVKAESEGSGVVTSRHGSGSRHEGQVVLVSEGEVPSKGTAFMGCHTVEVMAEGEGSAEACSSYLNVEWRALRLVIADGPERGRTIFPRHVLLLTEIMPRR
jgi:hypothetical protein